ncbi:MAG: transposase, partial [Sporocytophaga sp.]|nr:transposase [Sporocytophaga sp.]
EGTLMNNMLFRFKWKNSIILLDRGGGYFSTCKVILSGNSGFCIRIKASQSNFAKKALSNPLSDFITEWCASEEERSTCKRNKVDSESCNVRVTKIMLRNGETEILVSTLFDTALINEKAIQELYHLRWGVEEGFKKLKPKMKLEQFGCRRYEGIYQEFYSHIFMMNLVELVARDAGEEITKKTKERKLKYKYNWQNAFRYLRNKFIDIFHLGEFISSLEY